MNNNSICIKVENDHQYKLLMRRLEDAGHRWHSGHAPTEWGTSLSVDSRVVYIYITNNRISIDHGYGKAPNDPLSFDEYMNPHPNLNKELMGIIRGILNV
jgi:hypothetical protein